MKALVTGGGGFLGKVIARQLVERGDSVVSFSRGTYPELEKLKVRHFQGDLMNPDNVCAAMDGCDIVFHVAAKAGMWGPYEEYYNTNVTGTHNILEACRLTGVKRLVYTSSPSVVFNWKNMEGVDETAPYGERFESAYPETKAIAEKMVLHANDDCLATVALRPHLIWGPEDNHLVPRIIDKKIKGKLKIIGTGKNMIDTVYVENAAQAHLQAGNCLDPGSAVSGNAYFISNGEPIMMGKIINRILQTYGLSEVKMKVPYGIAYFAGWLMEKFYRMFKINGEPLLTRFITSELAKAHWFDISAARNDFGYNPEISIEEGFKLLEEWVKKTRH